MKFCALKAGGTAGAEDDIPSRNRCGSDRKGLRGQKIPGRDFLSAQKSVPVRDSGLEAANRRKKRWIL